jgi:hypothetical protein
MISISVYLYIKKIHIKLLTEQNLTYMSLPMVINQNQNKNTVPTIINLTPHIVRIAGPSDELLGEWAPSGRAVVSMETTVDKQLSESIGFSVGRTVKPRGCHLQAGEHII